MNNCEFDTSPDKSCDKCPGETYTAYTVDFHTYIRKQPMLYCPYHYKKVVLLEEEDENDD